MNKVNTVTLEGASVPKVLKRLHVPPNQLFTRGADLSVLLEKPRLAVVGSRKASPYGRAVTTSLVSAVARRGVVIVSGLALGVDSIAHAACLESHGLTIAVLPSSVEEVYPRSHAQLAQAIVSNGGLLVSEYDRGADVRREQFIARNRIIAGLAEALLITEAAENSGSLHTARFALDMGLPVLAVPGPITSPLSAGTNNLIRAGATPITSDDDIFTALNWKEAADDKLPVLGENEAEQAILDLIQSGVSEGAELQAGSKLSPAEYGQALTMLELRGTVRPLGADHWAMY